MTPVSRQENCTTRRIEMDELQEMKTLPSVEQRLQAWFDVVTSHSFLWKNHVEHGDPSLNNMMFDPESNCGVLTDFDLALDQWEPRVLGTDRTGTVPIMALNLLTQAYWKGFTQRRYYHEFESFIWMIPFLVLTHEDGERVPNTYIDQWRTSDFKICREKRPSFLQDDSLIDEVKLTLPLANREGWTTLISLCNFLDEFLFKKGQRRRLRAREDNLATKEDTTLIDGDNSTIAAPEAPHILESRDLWNGFVKLLHAFSIDPSSKHIFETHAVELFESVRPFSELTESKKAELAEICRDACAAYYSHDADSVGAI